MSVLKFFYIILYVKVQKNVMMDKIIIYFYENPKV